MPANTPARDFQCALCSHPYELKATSNVLGKKLVDGAYSAMMSRFSDGSIASFLLMRYAQDWNVIDLSAVHHSLLTPMMVEKRKPLAATARRAGWVGCNLRLDQIPPEGRIPIVQNGLVIPKEVVRSRFREAEQLASLSLEARTWTAALLVRLHRLGAESFKLNQVYAFEKELAQLFPANHHVREKLRQQLQVLRTAGFIRFDGRGTYTLTRRNGE